MPIRSIAEAQHEPDGKVPTHSRVKAQKVPNGEVPIRSTKKAQRFECTAVPGAADESEAEAARELFARLRKPAGIHYPGLSGLATGELRFSVQAMWCGGLRVILRSGSPFGKFVYRLLCGHHTSTPIVGVSGWPMPVPFPESWRKGGATTAGTAKNTQLFLNLLTAYLSWQHMRQPKLPPPNMRLGQALSNQQLEIVQRLKAWVKPWSQFPELKLAELGRGIDRARSLGEVIQALEVATVEIRNGLGSYCRPQGRQNSQTVLGGFRDRDPDTVSIGQFPSENVTIARDVVSTRLRFPGEPSFDPRPLFDFETKEAYEDPEALRLEAPTSRPPKVRIRASKDEQLRLFALWAAGGRLALAAAALVVWRCGLFTVYKSEDVDRMILDARPLNGFERALNKWTRTMGTVISVLGLFLPPGRVLALYADDIRDYYYQFKISRSPMAIVFRQAATCPA